ncbi:MAG: 3-phosphoshikimate 1-carboxyvinyltransferase [Ignavibacteria bacterium]|nr:3-phosphoshikimate 1-carboxyvinyltransferase [Ignavibacteria bacterium]
MTQEFNKIGSVNGELALPGDKSISHRAVIFSCMAEGISEIENLSNGEDVRSTLKCFSELGVTSKWEKDKLIIEGKGFKNFNAPVNNLDAGNSGTTARLLTGFLSAQPFESTLIGDESLSQRPMKRVIEPLSLMGAKFSATPKLTLPLTVHPSEKLIPITYEMPVASAQVKSSLLLAGLHLEQETCVIEAEQTRNHTEVMLGLKFEEKEGKRFIYSSLKNYPSSQNYFVPSDISSAAFFIVLTLLAKNSEVILRHVSLNETRTGVISVLKEMGANIEITNNQTSNNELYGDLIVRSSELHSIEISKEIIPNIIDEIPVLSAASVIGIGKFEIRNASELRVKESDRISALVHNYKILGLHVEEFPDGFSVSGTVQNENPIFESFHDHRIAMAFAILSMFLKNGGNISNFDCVKISNPQFLEQVKSLTK